MSLRTAAKLSNTTKTVHYPLVFSSFPEESRDGPSVPALVTANGSSELPLSVNINEIISSEASVMGSRTSNNPASGSKVLQKYRSIGSMANPITPGEQVRALGACSESLRRRASPPSRSRSPNRFVGDGDESSHMETQTPMADFSDDLVDDVSLITAHTAALLDSEGGVVVMPRDAETSLVVKPASANTIHQFRDFVGIVNTETDIASLVGQKVASSIVSRSLDNGFAPGSISLDSPSVHGWQSVDSQEDFGSRRETPQEAWLKAASRTGKPLETVVSTFKVGSAARRGKGSSGNRARVDSTGTSSDRYVTAGSASMVGSGSTSFNLPTLSAYGLSVNNQQNPIFANRPSTGPASVSPGLGPKRSAHSQGNSRHGK
jgi:hypothetical protein